MHSLAKSAVFFSVGLITQNTGTKRMNEISGLTVSHPWLGWGFVIGVLAIAGLPPLGIFMSEFLVVSSTFAVQPLLAVPLVLGILLTFGALVTRLQGLAFGAPGAAQGHAAQGRLGVVLAMLPLWAHLLLVLVAGLWLPAPLVAWFQSVARLLG